MRLWPFGRTPSEPSLRPVAVTREPVEQRPRPPALSATPAAWQQLAPIQRSLTAIEPVASVHFEDSLRSWRDPTLSLEPLSHRRGSAEPAGEVASLATIHTLLEGGTGPIARPAGTPLALREPARPVQRRTTGRSFPDLGDAPAQSATGDAASPASSVPSSLAHAGASGAPSASGPPTVRSAPTAPSAATGTSAATGPVEDGVSAVGLPTSVPAGRSPISPTGLVVVQRERLDLGAASVPSAQRDIAASAAIGTDVLTGTGTFSGEQRSLPVDAGAGDPQMLGTSPLLGAVPPLASGPGEPAARGEHDQGLRPLGGDLPVLDLARPQRRPRPLQRLAAAAPSLLAAPTPVVFRELASALPLPETAVGPLPSATTVGVTAARGASDASLSAPARPGSSAVEPVNGPIGSAEEAGEVPTGEAPTAVSPDTPSGEVSPDRVPEAPDAAPLLGERAAPIVSDPAASEPGDIALDAVPPVEMPLAQRQGLDGVRPRRPGLGAPIGALPASARAFGAPRETDRPAPPRPPAPEFVPPPVVQRRPAVLADSEPRRGVVRPGPPTLGPVPIEDADFGGSTAQDPVGPLVGFLPPLVPELAEARADERSDSAPGGLLSLARGTESIASTDWSARPFGAWPWTTRPEPGDGALPRQAATPTTALVEHAVQRIVRPSALEPFVQLPLSSAPSGAAVGEVARMAGPLPASPRVGSRAADGLPGSSSGGTGPRTSASRPPVQRRALPDAVVAREPSGPFAAPLPVTAAQQLVVRDEPTIGPQSTVEASSATAATTRIGGFVPAERALDRVVVRGDVAPLPVSGRSPAERADRPGAGVVAQRTVATQVNDLGRPATTSSQAWARPGSRPPVRIEHAAPAAPSTPTPSVQRSLGGMFSGVMNGVMGLMGGGYQSPNDAQSQFDERSNEPQRSEPQQGPEISTDGVRQLASRLYPYISSKLKAELGTDRERAGMITGLHR